MDFIVTAVLQTGERQKQVIKADNRTNMITALMRTLRKHGEIAIFHVAEISVTVLHIEPEPFCSLELTREADEFSYYEGHLTITREA